MAIATDFSIALNGDIRHVANTDTYSVLELHRFLQENADNASAATSDDLINITSDDPSSRATDQIITLLGSYNIDDTAAQYIYGGSIRQGSGATETLYSGLAVVGAIEDTTNLQIVQNDALLTNYWGAASGTPPVSLNGSGSTLLRVLVKSRDAGIDIDDKQIRVQAREYGDTYAEFGVTLGEGESTAAIFTATDLNNDTLQATVDAYDKHDNTEGYQLIDINDDGTDESYYSQWEITGTGTLPASPTNKSLYEHTKNITRRGTSDTIHGVNGELFRGITHSVVYDGRGGNAFVESDYVAWGTTLAWDGSTGDFTVGEKVTIDAGGSNNGPIVATLLALQDDGTSGVMVIDVEGTAVITDNDTIDGATSGADALVDGATRLVDHNPPAAGGEGLILADDAGTTGTLWIQLVKGSAPVNNLPLHGHDRTSWLAAAAIEAAVNVTVTTRTVNPTSYFATFTGTAFIGTYGSGIKKADGAAADLFFPLDSTTYPSGVNPPNNVQFDVNGLVIGDRVLVALDDGSGGIDITQLSNDALLNGAAVGTVVVTEAIPTDTPASGTIRIVNDEGRHIRLPYDSWDTSTFTLTSSYDFSGTGDNDSVAATNDTYITYLDLAATATTESFSAVYLADRTLRARVRDGDEPIKEATGTGTLGTNGGQININRIADA